MSFTGLGPKPVGLSSEARGAGGPNERQLVTSTQVPSSQAYLVKSFLLPKSTALEMKKVLLLYFF